MSIRRAWRAVAKDKWASISLDVGTPHKVGDCPPPRTNPFSGGDHGSKASPNTILGDSRPFSARKGLMPSSPMGDRKFEVGGVVLQW